MSRVIVCGGGLSGGLAAIALAKSRPDIELLLIEAGASFGGNHIWSFFGTDIDPACRWLIDSVATRRWPEHEVRFPNRQRILRVGYNTIQSRDLDCAVRATLSASQHRLGAQVTEIGARHVNVGGERIEADCVIDARGPGRPSRLDLAWQKFVGRVYRLTPPHSVVRPMIMDATVAQIDGFRFAYLLPLSETDLLIEDTYYSAWPLLDLPTIAGRLDKLAAKFGAVREVISEEHGALPVVVSGSLEDLWPHGDPVPRLGLAGGFFHPTTGYSLADALATAVLLAEQQDLRSEAVATLLRGRAARLWRERRFYQLLNRMLFLAAEPERRYRVLEHFYRLPTATISRFYAAQLTALDKLRILSGRPPVPIGRALSSLRGRAA